LFLFWNKKGNQGKPGKEEGKKEIKKEKKKDNSTLKE
jgi:hypothetical protein